MANSDTHAAWRVDLKSGPINMREAKKLRAPNTKEGACAQDAINKPPTSSGSPEQKRIVLPQGEKVMAYD